MNFYTLIFNKTSMLPKQWIKRVFFITFSLSAFIFIFNFLIDPYNVTGYNLLHIKYKFARDDRTEKITHFKVLPRFDNILVGSSRVYSINPKVVSDILGGRTYNFGVGTATVEDHLGILKYLIKENKIPKNLIIGVDFYTFNPNIPPNGYFLKNKELNFLSYGAYSESYLEKLFSIDAFRAAFKTLNHHLSNKHEKPRFDELGWARGEGYEKYGKINIQKEKARVKKEIAEETEKIYSSFRYRHIDPKRVAYYEEIKRLAKKHNIKLYVFTTPLHPLLLQQLETHSETKNALKEFLEHLKTFDNFTNLYYNPEIYDDLRNFNGATHTKKRAGDIMAKIVLSREKNE